MSSIYDDVSSSEDERQLLVSTGQTSNFGNIQDIEPSITDLEDLNKAQKRTNLSPRYTKYKRRLKDNDILTSDIVNTQSGVDSIYVLNEIKRIIDVIITQHENEEYEWDPTMSISLFAKVNSFCNNELALRDLNIIEGQIQKQYISKKLLEYVCKNSDMMKVYTRIITTTADSDKIEDNFEFSTFIFEFYTFFSKCREVVPDYLYVKDFILKDIKSKMKKFKNSNKIWNIEEKAIMFDLMMN
ncbi:hypothetical protein WA158_005898 [Blastocystis sp. Blastoise]